jgi:hypothetical protein
VYRQRTTQWMRALGRFGVSAIAAMLVGAATPQVHPGPTTVRLVLRYVSTGPVPVPRVTTPVAVRLPLYPGARLVTRHLRRAEENPLPATPYLRAAGALWRVPASLNPVLSWYTRVLTQDGLHVSTRGSEWDRGRLQAEILGFSPPSRPDEVIYVTAGPTAMRGVTRLVLWATLIDNPPRPRSSYLPPSVVRIVGTVGGKPVRVTEAATIARLVEAVNSLRVVAAGTFSCPAITASGTARLGFHLRDGGIRMVATNGCTVTVGSIPFMPDAAFDRALAWLRAHP